MEYEIDEIRKISIGGVGQKIHIRGEKRTNPVLLFLHGGPGISNRDSVVNREKDLCDVFTIVAWDQRGTGGSYWGVKKETLNLEQLISDAAELVEYLCAALEKEKLFVWGGSWGTELGTYLCFRYPEHIAGYVGSGQLVNGVLNEELSYDFAMDEAKKAGDTKAVSTLERIGRPVDGCYREVFKGMMAQRRIMKKYGGHSMNKGTYWTDTALPLLRSREFSFTDKLGLALGYKRCLTYMWPTTSKCDFPRECTRFAMPYYIFQGAHDNNTPSALVQAYYDAIEAPDKDLIWFEHSAHGPLREEPETYKRLLREKLLQCARGQAGPKQAVMRPRRLFPRILPRMGRNALPQTGKNRIAGRRSGAMRFLGPLLRLGAGRQSAWMSMTLTGQPSRASAAAGSSSSGMSPAMATATPSSSVNTAGQVEAHRPQPMHPSLTMAFIMLPPSGSS